MLPDKLDRKVPTWDSWWGPGGMRLVSKLPSSLFSSIDIVSFAKNLLFTPEISQKEADIFWSIFDTSREKLCILLSDRQILAANQTYIEEYWLQEKKSYSCDTVSHPETWCAVGDHPCPMGRMLSSWWSFDVDDHIHTRKDWSRWVDVVNVVRLPMQLYTKMPTEFRKRLMPLIGEMWDKPLVLHRAKSAVSRALGQWQGVEKISGNPDADVDVWLILIKLSKRLADAYAEIERVLSLQSDFIANISHEIRTPINGIIWLLSILRDLKDLNEGQEEFTQIEESSRHLLRLISDILDFSKIQKRQLEIENTNFNFLNLFNSLTATFTASIKEKQIDLKCIISEKIPEYMIWDPTRLRQILDNLISNAIKFTEKWWSIEIKCLSGELWIYFEVCDNWIWISAENQEKIFARFNQADTSTTRKYWWTWLGLSIVRQLVNLMWWNIELTSEEGQWSKFYFTLPLKIWKKQEQGLKLDESWDLLKWKKILLVDDNPVNQKVLGGTLIKMGIEVTIANNWKEAVKLFQCGVFDLVFMDAHMPVMDGFKAAEKIREKELGTNSNVPIIACTADATDANILHCKGSGMTDFIWKPIDRALLKGVLQSFLIEGAKKETVQEIKFRLRNNANLALLEDRSGEDGWKEGVSLEPELKLSIENTSNQSWNKLDRDKTSLNIVYFPDHNLKTLDSRVLRWLMTTIKNHKIVQAPLLMPSLLLDWLGALIVNSRAMNDDNSLAVIRIIASSNSNVPVFLYWANDECDYGKVLSRLGFSNVNHTENVAEIKYWVQFLSQW